MAITHATQQLVANLEHELMLKPDVNVLFVTGIDLHIGKTIATGYLAKQLLQQGWRTITQKMIETGTSQHSMDILKHRNLMHIPLHEVDHLHLTQPELLSYPAAPYLAARLEQKEIDLNYIRQCTETLTQRFEAVLIEGAGGLMVPITQNEMVIDYIEAQQYPIILVTSGRLGSINHTLLSLELIRSRNLKLYALAYNCFDDAKDRIVSADSRKYLKNYILKHFPDTQWLEIPVL